MSLEFNYYELGEISDVKGGKRLPKGHNLIETPNNHPYIKVKDMSNDKLLKLTEDFEYIENETFNQISQYTVKKSDLIVSIVGTIGLTNIIDYSLDNANLTENCAKITNLKEGYNIEFVYYYLNSNIGQNLIQEATVGAVQKKLPIKNIRTLKMPFPNITIQNKIVKILSTIDKKIEINKRINKNLLSIADAIFKKEFINFDEYLEEDLISSDFGLIPKNWYYKTLDEISDVAIGKTPPRKETWWFSEKEGVKWVSIKDLGNSGTYIFETSEYLTEEAIDKFNVKLIPEDTVILSFKLTVGRLGITTEEMTTNEAIAHFKLNQESPISKEYLYLYLKNFNYEELGSTSSIAKAINSKIVKKIPILVPESNKLNEFKELFENLFNEIKSNQLEINNLTKLRDTLLPKLMSGEIDVSQINCDLK